MKGNNEEENYEVYKYRKKDSFRVLDFRYKAKTLKEGK